MEFFNNKENENLKFKINSEGVDINKIEPRLILTTKENKNYLFRSLTFASWVQT